MSTGWARWVPALLSGLPFHWRQQRLWRAVAASQPAAVLRWLRAGADPNLPSVSTPALFAIHIPIQAALSRANGNHWSGPSLVVLRLLLDAGGKPDVCALDGQINAAGKAHLTAGVPSWLLLRSRSSDLPRLLETLLAVWVWRTHRATPEQLSRLLRLRRRICDRPLPNDILSHLFQRAPLSVLDQASALFHPLGPGAMAGAILVPRPELLVLFSGHPVNWDQVRELCGASALQHWSDFRQQHTALREQTQLEASTASAPRTSRGPHRL